MHRLVAKALLCTLVFLVDGCERRTPRSPEAQETRPPVGNAADELTAPMAIQLVKALVDSGGYRPTVSSPYIEMETQQVACGAVEVETDRSAYPHNPERWHCKSFSGGPPCMKTTSVVVNKCCKSQSVQLHSSQIAWDASPAPDDRWSVRGIYSVLGRQHTANWIVDRKTRQVGSPLEH